MLKERKKEKKNERKTRRDQAEKERNEYEWGRLKEKGGQKERENI